MSPSKSGLPRSGIKYGQVVLVWTPLVVAATALALGDSWSGFLLTLVIGEFVATFSFGATVLFQWLAARLGGTASSSRRWGFAVTLLALPMGLFMAYQATVWLAPQLGLPWRAPSFGSYRYGLFLGLACVFATFVWEERAKAREAVRGAELALRESENRRLQAQLAALSAQLNPHPLFNAINTVAAQIHDDPHAAEQTLLRLCDLYRGC